LGKSNVVKSVVAAGSALAAVGAGAMAYARYVEPNWLEVTDVELTLPRLAPSFDGYRIAQFSDLHMETWRNWTTLAEVIARANASDPDLVVITGDFVDEHAGAIADRLTEALSQLSARDGVVAIMGNHDYWGDADQVRRMLKKAVVRDLSNDVMTLRRGNERLHIAGLDSYMQMKARFDRVLECLPDDGAAAILLAHEPDFAYLSAPTGRFDLQLSGHSHGGQVRVPGLMQMVLPPFARRFIAGLRRVKGMYVYTNRGLGMSGVNMRFNCRPELTVFTLRAAEREEI
jgi:uncharacterized protein